MGNIYAYYLLTYLRMLVCLRIEQIYVLFVFIQKTIKYFTYARVQLKQMRKIKWEKCGVWYAFDILSTTSRPLQNEFASKFQTVLTY